MNILENLKNNCEFVYDEDEKHIFMKMEFFMNNVLPALGVDSDEEKELLNYLQEKEKE